MQKIFYKIMLIINFNRLYNQFNIMNILQSQKCLWYILISTMLKDMKYNPYKQNKYKYTM